MDRRNLAETLLSKPVPCLRTLDGMGSPESRLRQLLQLALSDPELYHSTFVWARVARQYLTQDFRPTYAEKVVEPIPLTFEWICTQNRSKTTEEAWIRKQAADWIFPTMVKKVPSAHRGELEDILDRWLQDTYKAVAILSDSSSRENKLLKLVTLGLTDGVFSSPAAITIDRFCQAFPIQLRLNLCKHCGKSYPKSSMKSGSKCWDCWDG